LSCFAGGCEKKNNAFFDSGFGLAWESFVALGALGAMAPSLVALET
jgi:hypothetical protein